MSTTTIAAQNANTLWGFLAYGVLREIFLWCIDIQTLAHPILSGTSPFVYTARLWTNIWIEFLFMIAKQWPSRARFAPVSIRISFIGPEKEDVWRIGLVDFLLCFRIEYLRFPIDTTSLLHRVLLDLPAAGLKTLDLTNNGERGEIGTLAVDDARFPSLSYLSLQSKWVLLPQSNALRTLHADSTWMLGHPAWISVLGRLQAHHNPSQPLTSHKEIRLPYLRILRLYFRNG